MSWEETGTRSIPCPCGKGVITRTDYMDDWNRSEEKYSIECPECRAKYKFVSQSYYKHAGDSGTVHYLLAVNYPTYNGSCLTDVFPRVVNIYQMPFEEYLIRTYTSDDLRDALSELQKETAVSRLTGVAAKIAQKHKKAFHTAKISTLRAYAESAYAKYNEISDNKDCRLPIEQKEQKERAAYEAERRKHLIHIPL